MQRPEIVAVEQVKLDDSVRNRPQLGLLGREIGFDRVAERARRLRPLGFPLALRIATGHDVGQQSTGSFARLCGSELFDAAERNPACAATAGRAILHDPHPLATLAQT